MYDSDNIFAKILRGEIPCSKVYEDAFALAFFDITPAAPTHIIVIPKGAYKDAADFFARANDTEILGFNRALGHITQTQNIADNFRLISNCGADAGQSVAHYHMHILAGKPLGPLLAI